MEIILITLVSLIIILGFLSFLRILNFTRWNLVDTFGLNKLFGIKPRKELTEEELHAEVARVIWNRLGKKKSILRNGLKIEEIAPLNPSNGHKYVIVCLDNRPYKNVCHVFIHTDKEGKDFRSTAVIQSEKDAETMMTISNENLINIYNKLWHLENEQDEDKKREFKKSIVDSYIKYMLQEIL